MALEAARSKYPVQGPRGLCDGMIMVPSNAMVDIQLEFNGFKK